MVLIRSHSPQNPDDVIVEVPEATAADVGSAAAAARQAQRVWASAPPAARAAALGSIADDVETAAAELTDLNAPTTGVDFHLPFGGMNRSSFGGREQGKAAMDFYTSLHTVTVAPKGSP